MKGFFQMSNYTNNPSMDEILERIKKALADRERRIELANETPQSSAVIRAEEEIAEMAEEKASYPTSTISTTSQPTEQSKISASSESSDTSDIIIKPNLANVKKSDVYVLSKDMKINSAEKFAELDFPKLFHELSTVMAKDLAIAYMTPKIESWLHQNFAQISTHCRKK